MGLDQYIYKMTSDGEEEVKYYRKNNQIQGFFEEHCNQQNCDYSSITPELCDLFVSSELNGASGFFYGNNRMDDGEREEANKLFMMIKDDIIRNKAEYSYYCWY